MNYRLACNLLLALAAACILAAIWAPGAWWQWLTTGVIVLFAAAYCGSKADKREGK